MAIVSPCLTALLPNVKRFGEVITKAPADVGSKDSLIVTPDLCKTWPE